MYEVDFFRRSHLYIKQYIILLFFVNLFVKIDAYFKVFLDDEADVEAL